MKKSIIYSYISIPTNNKTSGVSKPGKCPFHFPTMFIPAKFTPVIILLFLIVASIWTNKFNTSVCQSFSQRIAVISLIGNQPLRFLSWTTSSFTGYNNIIYRFFKERDFTRGRRVQVVSQRNTLAVDHHHPLRALAPLGFPDTQAPFFAGAKLPSINDSLQSNCLRSSSSARNARHASSQMSCSSQSFNLRQQVEGLEYRFGKSDHGAPVRKIQRIPSNTLRLSTHGLPPLLFTLGFGRYFSIFFHCSSVNFHRSFLAIVKTPFQWLSLHNLFSNTRLKPIKNRL